MPFSDDQSFAIQSFRAAFARGFPTIAERMKIHLTTTRNVTD
jgi:hypothetical protein